MRDQPGFLGKTPGDSFTNFARGWVGVGAATPDSWQLSLREKFTEGKKLAVVMFRQGINYSDEDLTLLAPVAKGGAIFTSKWKSATNLPKSLDDMPLIRSLSRVKWPMVGLLRVMFSMRRQDRLLASLYAERAGRMVAPSQMDFEESVDHFLDQYGWWLDFAKWGTVLKNVLGEGQVVPMTIGKLFDPQTSNPTPHGGSISFHRLYNLGAKSNVSQFRTNTWKLKDRARMLTTQSITLTPTVSEKIMKYYCDSNQRFLECQPKH
jgi:hypothetical protein